MENTKTNVDNNQQQADGVTANMQECQSQANTQDSQPNAEKTYTHISKQLSTSKIAKIAMLTALSIILLTLEFPIFPGAPFLMLNFSDLPALIGTFIYGPLVGIIITVAKVLLFMLLGLSKAIFVGDLANIIIGVTFCVVAGLIYMRRKTIKTAIVALAVSSVAMVLVACFANLFVLLPLYNVPAEARLSTVFSLILPFNSIKAVATCILTFIAYKPVHKLFNRIK